MDHRIDEIFGTRVFHADPNRSLEITTHDDDTVTSVAIKEQGPDGEWRVAAIIHLGNGDTAQTVLALAAHAAKAGGI